MIFLLVLISYRTIFLVSEMGSFFFQLAAVFILWTKRWGMVIKNCQRMTHFCCFQLHFFQLWKAKLGKYKKIEEKSLFIPFPLIFYYKLAKNQLPNTFFVKNMKIFHFLTPQMPKIYDFRRKKRPLEFNTDFNNQQNFLIFGIVTVNKNQKNL